MKLPLIKSKFALPVYAAVGIAVAVLITSFAPKVEHIDIGAPPPLAEFIIAKPRPFVPRATGYGFVEPATLLQASAEVSGRITFIHPALKAGSFLTKGTEVLRVDPTDYQLALAQARADVAAAKAQKKEQTLLLESARIAFTIAERNWKLGAANLERKRDLLGNGTISQASLDQEEQGVLKLRQDFQTRQQQLETLPSQIEVAAARIKLNEARVIEQEQQLARTKITLPFNSRIAAVYVDKDEYVKLGGQLFVAHSVNAVEITTRLSLASLQNLVAGMEGLTGVRAVNTPSELLRTLGVQAEVVLPDRIYDARWKGAVVRMGESQDMTTRTIAIVVRVEDPYGQIIPGKRPPLLKGMYVKVNLVSNPVESLVVPRHAVHGGKLYIATPSGRLSLRDVDVVTQDDVALVRHGLKAGERVIVTDLIPAVDGMKLDAKLSEKADALLNADSMPATAEVLR
jgi:HlyD family secretion protein